MDSASKIPIKRTLWLGVVTGLIRRGNQVLVGKRPPGHSLAGLWEFPGGKIERGEPPEEALARELNEELGIEATIGPVRLTYTHSYAENGIIILFFDVYFWKAEPKSVHHSEIRWVTPEELVLLDMPEANRKLLPKLIEILKTRDVKFVPIDATKT
jgi:8-oxo-dGTP diphosphatase